jgi:hypothetical protein
VSTWPGSIVTAQRCWTGPSTDWRRCCVTQIGDAATARSKKILRIHAKFIERIDVSGSLDHRPQGQRGDWELVEGMTDEMRQKALELLRLQRGALQRQLPARLTDPDRDATNGRFISHDDEEKTR